VILYVILLMFVSFASGSSVVQSGCEYDYPPFCFESESGEAAGFSVELLDAALAAMDVEADYRLDTWANVKGYLEDGIIQCLPLVGRTPERDSIFDFTFPYMTIHGAVVVPADCD